MYISQHDLRTHKTKTKDFKIVAKLQNSCQTSKYCEKHIYFKMIPTICYTNINLVVIHVVLDYTQIPVAAHADMTIQGIKIFLKFY